MSRKILKDYQEQDPGLVQTFKEIFLSPQGQIILMALEKESRTLPVSPDKQVNPNNAIYRAAQMDLIQFIKNKIE